MAHLYCDSLVDYPIVTESITLFTSIATTHSHVSMADITLPRPTMDWSASDHTQALRDFQQLWFTVNQTADALQLNYIMLWLGSAELMEFDSWPAPRPQEDMGQTGSLRNQPELPHPPSGNATSMPKTRRISGRLLHLHKDASAEMQICIGRWHTRILEQLIAGTAIPKVQRELLSKDDTLTLAQALDIARAHEASIKHMKQIQDLTPTPATSTIDAVSNNRSHKQCGNWRHSCPTQVPGIRYNVLPVPQEEPLAPGMPLGQQQHSQHGRRTGSTCQSFNEANRDSDNWHLCKAGRFSSGSRGFPSDWTSHRMHSSSAWIRSSVSAQAPSGSLTTSSSTARMTRTMTEISTTLWKLPRNVDLFSTLRNVSSRHCRSSSLEWFTTLMACTLTRKSALKSKRSPLQRMSQKFSSFSA